MLVAVGELLVAEIARPSGLASALPRPLARAVNAAAGIRHALGAIRSRPADAAFARVRPFAEAVFLAASRRAYRYRAHASHIEIFLIYYTFRSFPRRKVDLRV